VRFLLWLSGLIACVYARFCKLCLCSELFREKQSGKALFQGEQVNKKSFCRSGFAHCFLSIATIRVLFLVTALFCTDWLGGALQAAVNRDAEEVYCSEDYESNLAVAKQMVESAKKNLTPFHPDFAMSLNNLGALYSIHDRYAEAAPLLEQALAIREKILNPRHPDVALSLNNLAVNLLYFHGQGKKSYLQSKGDVKNDRERQRGSQKVQQRVQG
jgi:tetratricopeptide (TPR) repeat protein